MNFVALLFFCLVENENHCDFVKLRDMLLCTNMEDLKEQTHTRHYERYRRNRLHIMGFTDMGPNNQPVRWVEISLEEGDRWLGNPLQQWDVIILEWE